MEQTIKNKLKELEQEKGIKILFACETGSRAWGFPSPDSDYDVRIIYVHEQDWYISLTDSKDTIEMMLNDNLLDITGWDLRKSLQLLRKSNASMLERIQSPIVYQSDDKFMDELREISKDCFSPIAVLFHYLSMTKNCFEDVDSVEKLKLKRLFYALRAATACKWILDNNTTPPIVFMEMVSGLEMGEQLVQRIEELIEMKATVDEKYLHHTEPVILDFIKDQITRSDKEAKSLSSGNSNLDELNNLLRKTVKAF